MDDRHDDPTTETLRGAGHDGDERTQNQNGSATSASTFPGRQDVPVVIAAGIC